MTAFDDTPDPRPPRITPSLVLFVGFGVRPERELQDCLAQVGVRGLWLASAPAALGASAHARFDAVVLQVEGPMAQAARGFEGWRRSLRCPLLVVAGSADSVDEIMALELGADACLGAPVPPRRLRAHLLGLLRRAPAGDPGPSAAPMTTASAAGWALDRLNNRLERAGREVALTELQCALLQALIEQLGQVVPRRRLVDALARGRDLHARSVDVYVARLRNRLSDERVAELQIESVRGRGYRLSLAGAAAQSQGMGGALRWVTPGTGAGANAASTVNASASSSAVAAGLSTAGAALASA